MGLFFIAVGVAVLFAILLVGSWAERRFGLAPTEPPGAD